MKTINLIIVILFSFYSFSNDFKSLTKEERKIVKQIEKSENQSFKNVIKNKAYEMVVIEFSKKKYVLFQNEIEYIYLFENNKWIEQVNSEKESCSEHKMKAYVFYSNDYPNTPFIEIQPIDNIPSWTLYYQGCFFDNKTQSMIYYNEDASISIGDKYIFYEDGYGVEQFLITPFYSNQLSNNTDDKSTNN